MQEGRDVQSLSDMLFTLFMVLDAMLLFAALVATGATGQIVLLFFGVIVAALYAIIGWTLKVVLAAFGTQVCTTSRIESLLRVTQGTLAQISQNLPSNPELEKKVETKTEPSHSTLAGSATDGPVKPKIVEGSSGKVQCPCCGKIQQSDRVKCWNCAVDFLDIAER